MPVTGRTNAATGQQSGGVYIAGLSDLRRDLRKLSPELQKLMAEELKRSIAVNLVRSIQDKIPVSGKDGRHARDTVRVVSIRGGFGIRAGSARVPYYGWLDFGGDLVGRGRSKTQTISRPFLKRGRYIYPSIDENVDDMLNSALYATDKVLAAFEQGGVSAAANLLRAA